MNFDLESYRKRLYSCVEQIRRRTAFVPQVLLVLGSGLGDFADRLQLEAAVPYKEIEGFPTTTVSDHEGTFLFGYLDGVPLVCMKGRVHYYEGYSMEEVVLPLRVSYLLGARQVVITHAVGAINEAYQPGQFMVVSDLLSQFVPSPLRGPNPDELGIRFIDTGELYSSSLRKTALEIAHRNGIILHEGIYVQMSGPHYETPADIRMLRMLGADAVGMSSGCEALAAHHLGMEVCDLACLTNMAAGIKKEILSDDDVQKIAKQSSQQFAALVTQLIGKIGDRA